MKILALYFFGYSFLAHSETETFSVAIKKSAFANFHKSFFDSTKVNDQTISADAISLTSATLNTTAEISAVPGPSENSIDLYLVINSTTPAQVNNRTFASSNIGKNGKYDVAAQFQPGVFVSGYATKKITLNTENISHEPAVALAKAFITPPSVVTNQTRGLLPWRQFETTAQVSRDGRVTSKNTHHIFDQGNLPHRAALPFIKSRFAPNTTVDEIVKKIPELENSSARDAAEKLRTNLDTQAEELLSQIKDSYRSYFIVPMLYGLDPMVDRLAMRSGDFGAEIKGFDKFDSAENTANSDTNFSFAKIEINEKFIERLAKKRMAGLRFSETEIAIFLGKKLPPPEKPEDLVASKNEVMMTLDDNDPLAVTFKDDIISVNLRCSLVETKDQTYKNVIVSRQYRILHGEDNKIFISQLPAGPAVSLTEFSMLTDQTQQHIMHAFDSLIKSQPAEISTMVFLEDKFPLVIESLNANAGRLVLKINKK